MKTLKITMAAALMAALFAGCVGPAGPEGPQGPAGYTGAPGVNGSYSTGTSNPSDWSASGSFLIAGYNVSIITTNAEANGVIAVYFQSTSGNWAPLPDTYPVATNVEQTLTYNYTVGVLTLQLQNSDNTVPATPAAFNFKVVVIPTSIIKQHPGLDTRNYTMVMQLMNIKETK